jgi:hypothetical protein
MWKYCGHSGQGLSPKAAVLDSLTAEQTHSQRGRSCNDLLVFVFYVVIKGGL